MNKLCLGSISSVCLLWAMTFMSLSAANAEDIPTQEKPQRTPAVSQEQINQWVRQLSDDNYFVREKATRDLILSGKVAVHAVAQATLKDDVEAKFRAWKILADWSKSPHPDIQRNVRTELKALAHSGNQSAVLRAAKILNELERLAEVAAVKALKKLGAQITLDNDGRVKSLAFSNGGGQENLFAPSISNQGLAHIEVLTNLESLRLDSAPITDDGLIHLKGLHNLKTLSLRGTLISDKGLKHLAELRKIENLSLFGTGVSNSGMMILKKMPALEVLDLYGTDITEDSHDALVEIKRLKSLRLPPAGFTIEDTKRLQQAMPNCKINR